MCLDVILVVPDFSNSFIIECDASRERIGVVLMQKGQPIAFESRKLNEIEHQFPIYDKEMLVVMHALEKFKQYLVCGCFVRTDHNSLKFFLS